MYHVTLPERLVADAVKEIVHPKKGARGAFTRLRERAQREWEIVVGAAPSLIPLNQSFFGRLPDDQAVRFNTNKYVLAISEAAAKTSIVRETLIKSVKELVNHIPNYQHKMRQYLGLVGPLLLDFHIDLPPDDLSDENGNKVGRAFCFMVGVEYVPYPTPGSLRFVEAPQPQADLSQVDLPPEGKTEDNAASKIILPKDFN